MDLFCPNCSENWTIEEIENQACDICGYGYEDDCDYIEHGAYDDDDDEDYLDDRNDQTIVEIYK